MNIAVITEICTTTVTVVTLILGFLSQHRQGNSIHEAVNSTNTSLMSSKDRVEQLTAALTTAEVVVPKSKIPPEEKEV